MSHRQPFAKARPGARPVRVLLIDDSPTMRRLIALSLARDPRIEVVGGAGGAAEALERIASLRPDALTLDVEMPGTSGLDLLEQLMRERPMPVVMVSSATQAGSHAAVTALALGAVDCVAKPKSYMEEDCFAGLADKLVVAAAANLGAPRCHWTGRATRAPPPAQDFDWNGSIVLIGASTGGIEAVGRVLSGFPADGPPTVVIQHMPEGFLASFAARLQGGVAPEVVLAREGLPLRRGRVAIAPGGAHHLGIAASAEGPVCRLLAQPRRNGHCPSVDVTFESALTLAPAVVAALLTGMGRDGVAGLARLRQAGAACLAQDRESAVVWGMPGAAWTSGAAGELVGLDAMAGRLLALTSRRARG
ncbi:chemotaxis-specific protein-glutamate methyltransferase CheB [Paracoccus sp. S-4012]|uniref:chemotaxis-specific protein-glutamate methyltransferase CheB n=1 Tax=Paracoccus sp. S-4012 TaxID=2665648 RepID=UPI0012AF981F|nr:chemotaxis-specific protein-glutamate methyltransferase CheB [Paracoccus sp. S-4012]MRX51836.1 chemotaxis-specific protein-glutamate methyltransferase CheB [Paracoccus sp. S-4012]